MNYANTRELPDAYAKGVDSNNYKLLRLLSVLYERHKADLDSINRAHDISYASGETLDNIGAMAGVDRNGDTDAQYRLSILAHVAALSTTGDCDATIARIEQMLGLESGTISITEVNSTALGFCTSVIVNGLTMDILQSSKFTPEEMNSIVQSVIPAGVKLVPLQFAGTLAITSSYAPLADYRTLYFAWRYGQRQLATNGVQVGLSGEMNVPEIFAETALSTDGVEYPITGTYAGGTLGVNSGDYISEVV